MAICLEVLGVGGPFLGEVLYYESCEVLEQLPREAVDAPSILEDPGARPGWMGPWAAWAGLKWGGSWPCVWWGVGAP